jgi:hypothetical protein
MSFAWISHFYIDDADYQARLAARKTMMAKADE